MVSSVDISVLIATRNRAHLLDATLEQLALQDVGGLRWQVIVVDNGSSDATPEILASNRFGLPLVHLVETQPGKNRSLNRALKLAAGDLLVFTDDDVIPVPRWLTCLHAAAARFPEEAVFAGPVKPKFPPETPDWLRTHPFGAIAFSQFAPDASVSILSSPAVACGPNYAVRASAFAGLSFNESVGPAGPNYAMGSETELLARLAQRGARAVFVPEALVEHVIEPHQTTVPWLYERAFRSGRGQARMNQGASQRCLRGIPLTLYRRFVQAHILRPVSFFFGRDARFTRTLEFHRVRGMLYEYALIAGERRGRQP